MRRGTRPTGRRSPPRDIYSSTLADDLRRGRFIGRTGLARPRSTIQGATSPNSGCTLSSAKLARADEESWSGLLEEHREAFETMLAGGPNEGRTQMVEAICASRLHFLFTASRPWTMPNILPLLDWADAPRAIELGAASPPGVAGTIRCSMLVSWSITSKHLTTYTSWTMRVEGPFWAISPV